MQYGRSDGTIKQPPGSNPLKLLGEGQAAPAASTPMSSTPRSPPSPVPLQLPQDMSDEQLGGSKDSKDSKDIQDSNDAKDDKGDKAALDNSEAGTGGEDDPQRTLHAEDGGRLEMGPSAKKTLSAALDVLMKLREEDAGAGQTNYIRNFHAAGKPNARLYLQTQQDMDTKEAAKMLKKLIDKLDT